LLRHFDRAVLAVLATRRRRNRSPLKFFLLILALSLPFWLLGAMIGILLLPDLPVSSLMFVCPAMAAAEDPGSDIVSLIEEGMTQLETYLPP